MAPPALSRAALSAAAVRIDRVHTLVHATSACNISSRMTQLPKYVQRNESLNCSQEYTGNADISVVATCGCACKIQHHANCLSGMLRAYFLLHLWQSVASVQRTNHCTLHAMLSFTGHISELAISFVSPVTLGPWHAPMAKIITAAPPPTLLLDTNYGFDAPRVDIYLALLASLSLTFATRSLADVSNYTT